MSETSKKCGKKCEVYSRVVGYHRPIQNWNRGKKAEYKDRVVYAEVKSIESKHGKCRTLEAFNESH